MGAQKNNPFSAMTAGESGDHTGGYGVTQTNGKYQSVPQIDPSQALAYYQQAGTVQSQDIAAGNTAYQAALKQAAGEMQEGYNAANETLSPLSTASNQALTLFQQMLGITPANPTQGFGADLLKIDPTLTNTANLISQANAATDPIQRAALSQQVQQQLTAAGNTGVNAANPAITALGPNWTTQNPGPGLTYLPQQTIHGQTSGGVDVPTEAHNAGGSSAANSPAPAAPILAQNQASWETASGADQQALTSAQTQQGELGALSGQWNNTYNTATPPQAFTGQQVAQQIQSIPGYQFQLDQGNQQILRNQAAVGNLGTGNTQVALANYGQGLASNYYNSYMGGLAQLINTGVPATQQIASNQANEGGYLSNLTQLGGQANYDSSSAQGAAMANSLNNMGQTSYNAAALNASLQFQAFALNQNSQNQAASSAAGLAGQAIQAQQQNASGAGFYQGMNAQVAQSQNYINSGSGGSVSTNGGAV